MLYHYFLIISAITTALTPLLDKYEDSCVTVTRDASGRVIRISLFESDGFQIDNSVLEEVATLQDLEKLTIYFRKRTFNLASFGDAIKGNSIKHLTIGCGAHVDEGLLQSIASNCHAGEIDLGLCKGVENDGVSRLLKNPYLKRLNLRNTEISSAIAEKVSEAGRLESLDVSYTNIDDSFCSKISLTSLQHISVSYTNVSPRGLQKLALLKGLTRVDCFGIKLSRDAARRLSESPNLKSIHCSKGDVELQDAKEATIGRSVVFYLGESQVRDGEVLKD